MENLNIEKIAKCVLCKETNLSIKDVYFNGKNTTIKWRDGDITTVKCMEGDEYSRLDGFALAVLKKFIGEELPCNKEDGAGFKKQLFRAYPSVLFEEELVSECLKDLKKEKILKSEECVKTMNNLKAVEAIYKDLAMIPVISPKKCIRDAILIFNKK